MVNRDMYELGSKRSVIRELFEYGKARIAKFGKDSTYDFSLGNPNVPTPNCVNEAVVKYATLPDTTLTHGYTSAQGDPSVRRAVADSIAQRFGVPIGADNIYITCGAAASLCITLRALNEGADEFLVVAPFFPEYTVFVRSAGGVIKIIPMDEVDFQIDFDALQKAISPKTKGIIINSPNNPSGAVYTEATIRRLCQLLLQKQTEYGKPIYIICDEPYREIVYDDIKVPYLMNYYDNVIVNYSYSKALSLPGERIGYIAVSPNANAASEIYAAICGAGRALGYVCAPSLFQYIIRDCVDATADLTTYKTNRDILFGHLSNLGFTCVRPDGAFYLLVKCPTKDATEFCNAAKELGILIVAGDDFGAAGYCRIAYCVSTDVIKRALPAFEQLAKQYR